MENKGQNISLGGTKPIRILLVEDSQDDVLIVRHVFDKIKLFNLLYIVYSGEEALDFIYHRGKYEEMKPPKPGLILLDIMMPGIDGFKVLSELKKDPVYKKTPVIMLTTSDREEDIVKSYKYGACSYITKPVRLEDFIKVLEYFEIYWTLVSKIPSTMKNI